LRSFSAGLLSEAESEQICQHLESCSDCRNVLDSSPEAADELLAILQASEPADTYEDEPECQLALAGVLGAPRSLGAASPGLVAPPVPARQYRLLEKLGAGGMGIVFRVVHEGLGRTLALKVLLPERVQQPEALARFDREIRFVGQLNHPNVVQPTDGGEENGVRFLVMEYVDGVDLATLTEQVGPLPLADACEIVRQAAAGLEHAHERGIVHRDIKPSNLMVDRRGIVKILDFGVAHLRADAEGPLTTVQHVMGTVDYMAPEQADDAHEVDQRADVYGLGATLYKLLCGESPVAGDGRRSFLQKLRALAAEDVRPIRQRRTDVPAGLAAALDRLLAKDPAARYPTAAAAAAALAPWTAGNDLPRLVARVARVPGGAETVQAREGETLSGRLSFLTAPEEAEARASSSPPRTAGSPSRPVDEAARSEEADELNRLRTAGRKPSRRWWGHRTAVVAAGLAAVVAALGIVIHLRGRYGELTMELQPDRAKVVVDLQRPAAPAAVPSWFPSPPAPGKAWELGPESALAGILPRPARLAGIRHWQIAFAPLGDTSANATLRRIRSVAWSPDGRWLAVAGGGGDVRLLSRDGRVVHRQLGAHTGDAKPLAWSADGQRLATTGWDGTVRLWDDQLRALQCLRDHQAFTLSAAWDPVSGRLASGDSAGKILVWDAAGQLLKTLDADGWVWGLAWSPDGKTLAAQAKNEIWLWDSELARGPTLHPEGEPVALAWSPDGSRLAVACMVAQTAEIWTAAGELERVLSGHTDEVWAVAWSRDGKRLASSGRDSAVRIWNADGTLLHVLPPAAACVLSVSFAPDRMLATCGYDGRVTTWDSDSGLPVWVLAMLEEGGTATFTAAGQLVGGDPDAMEKSLRYVVQPEDGDERTMKPSEFYTQVRFAPAGNPH